MNRHELRHIIAKMTEGRDFRLGTVSAMSGSAVRTLTVVHFPASHFSDGELFVYSGAAVGQGRIIYSHTVDAGSPPAYGELTPFSAFSPAPIAGDLIEVHPLSGWTADQFNVAVNQAYFAAEDTFLVDKKDITLTMVAGINEYAIPAGFRYLSQVAYDQNKGVGTDRYKTLSLSEWEVIPGEKKLWIGSPLDGYPLRLIGQMQAALPTLDASIIDLPERYAVTKAAANLLAMQPGGESKNQQERERWAVYWDQQALIEAFTLQVYPHPNSRAVEGR